MRRTLSAAALCAAVLLPSRSFAQADAARLSVDRIFKRGEFRGDPVSPPQWMRDGVSYLETRANPSGGTDLVRIDAATGTATVLVAAESIVGEDGKRIAVSAVTLSSDESKALLFHDVKPVWPRHRRGTYHVLDLALKKVTAVSTRPGLQMFAKFSPDGRMVSFFRDDNLFVTDLATGAERALTTDGDGEILNGVTDWVYEEELGFADAYRWSPDSRRIAWWRFDQHDVPIYTVLDELPLYPVVKRLHYPKAGQANARVTIGVLDVSDGQRRWLDVGGDTGIYIARMEWANADSLVILRLPRRQNRLDVLMASATGGGSRLVLAERDSAYVDVEEPVWINGGRQFLWLSDRTGWRQLFLYNRDGTLVRQLSADGSDVLGVAGVDEKRGDVYATLAAPTPIQRQVWRYSVDGKRSARATTAPGSHALSLAPGGRFAVDLFSSAASPPATTLLELPALKPVRALVENKALQARVAALAIRAPQFFRIPMPDGLQLDAWRLVPANFDSTKKYPVLMYVYGGPASPTVLDAWGGERYLWHQMLTQLGYVVVSVDNRGAAWRGRAFRKVTQLRMGTLESRDQIDAASWLGAQPWVDAGRIGIWGKSYGGFMTTLTAALGGPVFRVAIAAAPVTDWRLYDTIYTERYMWVPAENAENYRATAPLNHLEGLTARYLVVHGTGDDNVHQQNTLQLADKLEALGTPFSMVPYPNRNHAIAGGNTQVHWYATMTQFVLDHL